MKKLLLVNLFIMSIILGNAQINQGGEPLSKKILLNQKIPTISLEAVSSEWIKNAALEDDKNGDVERVAKNIITNIGLKNAGKWDYLHTGERVWRLKIKAQKAKGINPLFKDFYLPQGAKLFVYSPDYKQVLGAFTAENNHESKLFSTEVLFGNEMIIEYIEPKTQYNQGNFTIEKVGSFYKDVGVGAGVNDVNESASCEVNINCSPVGDNWQDEKRGVARILVVNSGSQGWCTGSLVNNGASDCKNYFLTALHCGDNPSTVFNQWVFYFNYEFSGCANASSASHNSITGATFRAQSNDLTSTATSSDFLLLELNGSIPSSYNVYYNGWNISATAPSGGVGIHHPRGDVKKISTFSGTPTSAGVQWSSTGSGYSTQSSGVTHWNVQWTANSNGHGVTEGGSSGSPIFNNSGQIVGTLTGGGSSCSSQNSRDQYGKMSYHWTLNAAASNRRLKPWLDPSNSGITSMPGTNPPCTPIGDDAGISAIINPTGDICAATIVPEVTLKNFGSTTLTSVVIKYQINTGTIYTYNWSGSLAPNATTNVTLPSTNAPAGSNTFTAYTQSPNGNADGNNGNNSSDENFVTNNLIALPVVEGFETGFPPANFALGNNDNDKTWEQTTTAHAGAGSKSMYVDNWDYNAAGQFDWLVTETYDFSSVNNASLTFDLAYAYYDQTNGTNTAYDTLGIAYSTDCGNTFYWLWKQGGVQLATAGGLGGEFTPTSSQWTNKSINISSLYNQSSVQLAFININGYGNNMYIDNININNFTTPTPPIANFAVNKTSVCKGNSISFSDNSANAPTSWSWSFQGGTPATSSTQNPSITYNTPGTYQVSLMVSNAYGSDTETKTNYITVHNNPNLSLMPTPAQCFGESSGYITANVTGGSAPYTYYWNGASSANNVYNNLFAGNYTCSVTDANTCTSSTSATITQPAAIVFNISTVDNAPDSTSTITSNATGGTPPLTYFWSNGNASNTINNLAPGAYTLTVKDSKNCTADTTIYIGKNTTGIVENIFIEAISLYPNPVENELNIEVLFKEKTIVHLNILNALGQNIYTKQLPKASMVSEKLSFEHLAKGIYYLELKNNKGRSIHKFVKMK